MKKGVAGFLNKDGIYASEKFVPKKFVENIKPIFLTPTLAGFDISYPGGWCLWRLFSFNLPYSDPFLKF